DQGLVMPPKIAPLQVVVVPIYKGEESKPVIDAKAKALADELKKAGIRVSYDDSDHARPGWKFAEYELKGVPVRIAMGLRDIEQNNVEIARRDTKEKKVVSIDGLKDYVVNLLEDIQQQLFNRAKTFRDEGMSRADHWEDFCAALDKGGFVSAHWDGTPETEEKIKELTKATIRCIPLNNPKEQGVCVLSGKPSAQRVLFARAY
ncbi:MAG: proline--tRNA ligase, partial [Ferruginibacter sp.]|nr:proline--tRNA ligase [Ferruginibacter sp.]